MGGYTPNPSTPSGDESYCGIPCDRLGASVNMIVALSQGSTGLGSRLIAWMRGLKYGKLMLFWAHKKNSSRAPS